MLNGPELASFSGLMRTLLWLLIGWFIIRTVSRMFNSGRKVSSPGSEQPPQKGEVSIDRTTPPSSGKVDEGAEFVDFEEIDETNTNP